VIEPKALALTLGHKDFSVKGGTEFSVDDGDTWTDLNGLTDAQRSTYDTELAALTARHMTDSRISELKKLLQETDYVAMPDYDQDKADVLVDRQSWREEIRTLSGG
jgi:DNA-binding FadR family transcriptional regulator